MLKHMLTTTNSRAQPAVATVDPMAELHAGRGDRLRSPPPLNISLNMSQRLNHSHALNLSTLSTSKHSLGGNSSSVSPANITKTTVLDHQSLHDVTGISTATQRNGELPKMANGGLNIPRRVIPANVSRFMQQSKEVGVKEMLTSLGLLCLVSLLLALLSLIFLLKISPVTATDIKDILQSEQVKIISAEEYIVVYEVTLALCALTLSLNLCCLLVCAIQFLFAVKLVKSPQGGERTNKYLQKSSITRVCAVGGFFVSIPVFLTGIILYTFIQFHSTPAIITSVFIGLGIIFCGCAMVHNVFVWQREKTNAVRSTMVQHSGSSPLEMKPSHARDPSGSISPGVVPPATLDLSSVSPTTPHELSTLV